MKVIFLDIDGVLNCCSSKSRCQGFIGIDDKRVRKLKKIVRATGAKIVLSSTWKYDWEPVDKELQSPCGDYLDRKLKREHLKAIDKTHEDNCLCRGEGILSWISAHDVEQFIIIDDEWYDFIEKGLKPKVIKTDFHHPEGGLTDSHVAKAIKLLNNNT